MSVGWIDTPGSEIGAFDAIDFSVTPASDGPVPWGAIYSADFTALPAQAVLVPGPVVIDGVTWWMKGALSDAGSGVVQSSALEPGAGLRIRSNFGTEGTNTAGYHMRYFLPFVNLPEYNPAAPLVLLARVSSDSASASSNAIAGVCEGTADAVALTLADRGTRVGCGYKGDGINTAVATWIHNAVASLTVSPSTAPDARVSGVHLLNDTRTYFTCLPWSGGVVDPYPPADLLTVAAGSVASHVARDGARLGAYYTYNFNGGSTKNFWLRNLYVMQPKKAAS